MKDANKDQHKRYTKALPNLIYTNCLDFHFYKNGELIREISIADFLMGIQPKADQFDALANQLKDFAAERLQTITSSKRLAELMAGKAALIKDVLGNALKEDENLQSELAGQYHAFKEQLIHDLTPGEFSDIYAETVAYGMFAARLHDETLSDFSREEALTLLPKSNPFLRNLFSYVAGPTLDERLVRTIDELADIFQATDLQKLFDDFGKFTRRNDPFIHFYETFLAEYNPKKRKARGVWYTPEPVVNFIVRAVDDVLKGEFGLADGLADTSKVTIDWDTGQTDKKGKAVTIKKDVHRVQILDPATGTGTFLAEVIKQIAPKIKNVAPGMWSSYIEQDLIPRIHGFELLMASYAMCHMKLDMMLTELGYKPTGAPPRLGVYLTNSLEAGEAANQTLPFAQWLSNESKQASTIKRDMPIMCVIGNPPYSGESANKGDWIMGLMDAYKKEPGGVEKLKEKNTKWINKDEHKFIRLAQNLIEKNKEGILSYISSHGYLNDPTLRGMRWSLLNSFDKIFVIDLHGNSNKKETCPDGSPDKNVFDIMQGVAIIIAIKTRHKKDGKSLAQVKHFDLWGSRPHKYEFLWQSGVQNIKWNLVESQPPRHQFSPFDHKLEGQYLSFFSLPELFNPNGDPAPGIVTTHDQFAISWDKVEAVSKVRNLLASETEEEARKIFRLCTQKQWNYGKAKESLRKSDWESELKELLYRPFDHRFTVYNSHVAVHRRERMTRHFVSKKNLGLIVSRMTKGENFAHALATTHFSEAIVLSSKTSNNGFNFPLYLYPDEQDLDQSRRVNFDLKIRKKIEDTAMGLPTPAGDKGTKKPDEVAIFDYIYGVLHCPAYRETYKEFLKIDFPRIPYPSSPESFWDISAKGTLLRQLHLMEDAAIGQTPYPFDGEGDTIVDEPKFIAGDDGNGSVFINKTQSFSGVPEIAWNFYIGGYQPAQKWLKDRKGRELAFDDVRHYQKIIKILTETDRIMKTVEMELN